MATGITKRHSGQPRHGSAGVPLSDACRSTEAVSVPRDRMSIPPQKSAADFTDRPACGLSSPHRSELNYPRRMGERVGGF